MRLIELENDCWVSPQEVAMVRRVLDADKLFEDQGNHRLYVWYTEKLASGDNISATDRVRYQRFIEKATDQIKTEPFKEDYYLTQVRLTDGSIWTTTKDVSNLVRIVNSELRRTV